jgi:hypothetical protein
MGIVLVTCLCACGGNAPPPSTTAPPTSVAAPPISAPPSVASPPISAPAVPPPSTVASTPPGVELDGTSEAGRQIFGGCADVLNDECESPLWPLPILHVSAASPRQAVCDASATNFVAQHFRCNHELTRCTDDGLVFLLAPTTGTARILTTIIEYPETEVPAEEPPAVQQVIADREHICALLAAVRSDPSPLIGDAFVEVRDGIDAASQHTVTCGAEARAAALTAAHAYANARASCGRFQCLDRAEQGNATSALYAERDAAGALHILAYFSGLLGSPNPFAGVHDALHRHPCP